MQNQNRHEPAAENQEHKTKHKKKGKVADVYAMYKKGLSIDQIYEKTKLSKRIVRSYIWRAANPAKYQALLKRYYEKKKTRLVKTAQPKQKDAP